MSATAHAVVRMANQIALNFQVLGDDRAAVATAEHIVSYWDPLLKATAIKLLDEPENGLSKPAREAIRRLASGSR